MSCLVGLTTKVSNYNRFYGVLFNCLVTSASFILTMILCGLTNNERLNTLNVLRKTSAKFNTVWKFLVN